MYVIQGSSHPVPIFTAMFAVTCCYCGDKSILTATFTNAQCYYSDGSTPLFKVLEFLAM